MSKQIKEAFGDMSFYEVYSFIYSNNILDSSYNR